jgi:hypothetical protein
MNQIDEHAIEEALLTAPGWPRVGRTAPAPWMRRNAAIELARAIIDRQPSADVAPPQEWHGGLTL